MSAMMDHCADHDHDHDDYGHDHDDHGHDHDDHDHDIFPIWKGFCSLLPRDWETTAAWTLDHLALSHALPEQIIIMLHNQHHHDDDDDVVCLIFV